MNFEFNYILPKQTRKGISKPAGDLLEGPIEKNTQIAHKWFKEHSNHNDETYQVICVGDVVSEAFINDPVLNKHLKMCVVDGKTKRAAYKIDPGNILPNRILLKNPPAIISGEASKKIKEMIESEKKYFVEIDGEEDLLVIPIVIFSKNNTFVVYGQPPVTALGGSIPAGMVIITVNPNFKKGMELILDSFEKEKIKRKNI